MEIYGATRKMDGGVANEDAFTIMREPHMIAAIADGSGNAQRVAPRILIKLNQMMRNTQPEMLKIYRTWEDIMHSLDVFFEGGPHSTLIAAMFLGEGIYGACVGDSRAYLVPPDCYHTQISADCKPRLGSGECQVTPIHARLKSEDYLLLASDGAYGTLDRLSLQRAQREAQHFSDTPSNLLKQASRWGAADDMTIVVARRTR